MAADADSSVDTPAIRSLMPYSSDPKRANRVRNNLEIQSDERRFLAPAGVLTVDSQHGVKMSECKGIHRSWTK
jgi:hypothetical protein